MEPTERIDIDRFDAWLDQLAQGVASPAPDDAADLAQAAIWLQQQGQQTMSPTRFEQQLGTHVVPALTDDPNAPVVVLSPHVHRTSIAISGRSRRALMAAAAAILIAVPAILLLVRSLGGGSNEPTIPAPTNGLAQSGTPVTCSVMQPPTLAIGGTPEHEAMLFATTNDQFPNIPGASGPALYQEDLPTGPAASSDELAGIQRTLDALAACLYMRDYTSVEALFSDDSFRRSGLNRGESVQGTPDPTVTAQATPVNPLRNLTEPVTPMILSSNVLPDGRIGVLLEQDVTGYGLEEYFIFVDSERGWLIDENVYVTTRLKPSPVPSMIMFKITASDLAFTPSRIEIHADTYVTLIINNDGKVRKTFVIPELDIDKELPPGEKVSILVKAPKGVYEFYSDVPGQRAAGMHGLIIVVP